MDAFLSNVKRYGLGDAELSLLARNYTALSQVRQQTDFAKHKVGSSQIHVLLDGWACKYRLMADGRRQVLSVLLPGDVCDLDKIFDENASFGVAALNECRIATISLPWLKRMIDEQPNLRQLFWSMVLFENLAMVEQVVSLGRRSARERTAYLLCDLLDRLQQRGEAQDGRFRLPLTQADMADHLGLSTVHVNRTLQDLKAEGLVESGGRAYRVCNQDGLKRLAGFSRPPAPKIKAVMPDLRSSFSIGATAPEVCA